MTKRLQGAKDAFTEELCDRLSKVTLERNCDLKMIRRFDTADAFHFVDPPYINSDCGHYEGMFTHVDLISLLDLLAGVQGKFMLTMYPHEEIDLYAQRHGWMIIEVERTISSSRINRKKKPEWILLNY